MLEVRGGVGEAGGIDLGQDVRVHGSWGSHLGTMMGEHNFELKKKSLGSGDGYLIRECLRGKSIGRETKEETLANKKRWRILLNFKKEGNPAVCDSMHAP